MVDSPVSTDASRRTVLRSLGALAVGGALAGCSTETGDDGDGGDGGDDTATPTPTESGDGSDGDGSDGGGSDGGGVPSAVSDYLSDVDNFEGVEDMTGQGSVTVMVGTEGNNGNFAFEPAAIRVDSGTTVTWEWTGQGGQHNVMDEDGAYESELMADEGHTFEHTFDESGASLYYCQPHKSLGMKGAVIVG